MKHLWFGLFAFAACGDGPDPGSSPPDAPIDTPTVPSGPFAIPVTATQADELQAAIAGPDGSFYAAGFILGGGASGPPLFAVKLTSEGRLDPAFGGGDGIALTTHGFAIAHGAIDLAIQSDGKLVVAAQTVLDPTQSGDRGLLVFRLDARGELDPTFGDGGTRLVDLSMAPDLSFQDAARDVAIDAADAIYLLGSQYGGAEPLQEAAVVKLTADGELDLAWGGGDGKHVLSIADKELEPSALLALEGGGLAVAGYAFTPEQGADDAQPVLYKLTAAGELDPSFAEAGVHHQPARAAGTTIDDLVRHGDRLVTVGRGTGDRGVDVVSLRFALTTGARDPGWGGAVDGVVALHPLSPTSNQRARAEAAVALPDGKTLLLGSVGPVDDPAQDAFVIALSADGALDTSAGTGIAVHAFSADSDDQLLAGAVSGDQVLAVGVKGVGLLQSAGRNDDSYGLLMPVR